MTGVSGPRCSSSASLTSDSTNWLSHCATSSRPLNSASSKARPSTTRTSPSIGSTPRRTHARSANDTPATSCTSMVGIGAQQRDRALGDRGTARHRVDDLTVLVRGRDQSGRDLRVRRFEVGGGVVDVVERRERDAVGQEIVDRGMAQRTCESMRRRRQHVARDRQEVIGTRRSEAQRDDPVRHRGSPSPSPEQPVGRAHAELRVPEPVARVDVHVGALDRLAEEGVGLVVAVEPERHEMRLQFGLERRGSSPGTCRAACRSRFSACGPVGVGDLDALPLGGVARATCSAMLAVSICAATVESIDPSVCDACVARPLALAMSSSWSSIGRLRHPGAVHLVGEGAPARGDGEDGHADQAEHGDDGDAREREAPSAHRSGSWRCGG